MTDSQHDSARIHGDATTSSNDLPNLLLDAVRFGLEALVADNDVADFAGALSSYRTDDGTQPRKLTLAIPVSDGETALGSVTLVLHLLRSPTARSFRLGSSSYLHLNPMEMLRCDLGLVAERGLDGAGNLIGPHPDDARRLLARQLQLIALAVDTVRVVLGGALADGARVDSDLLRLRSAEACRDISSSDAVRLVRRLQRSALAGTLCRAADCYRVGTLDERGNPTVRWWATKQGPVSKAYAKRRDMIRTELTCRNRKAVKAFLGATRSGPIDPNEAVRQLLLFLTAAEAPVGEIAKHVVTVSAQANSMADLVLALLPLAELADGRCHGRGAPPDQSSRDLAKTALDDLMREGTFHATNLPKTGAVRRVLERLAGPPGPLMRQGHAATYSVRPSLIPA